MTKGFISLSMYDWPELSDATAAFKAALKDRLHAMDFAVVGMPAALSQADMEAQWIDAHLLIGQTCGLPLVMRLKNEVGVIGTPAYAIDSAAGEYHSVIITHCASAVTTAAELEGLVAAVNGFGSQSGYGALQAWLLAEGCPIVARGRCLETGSHRASIVAVADGRADFASIDAVTFALAQRHEMAAAKVRVLAKTKPTPGLPMITAAGNAAFRDQLGLAVAQSIEMLEKCDRRALLLTGFVSRSLADYAVIEQDWRRVLAYENALEKASG